MPARANFSPTVLRVARVYNLDRISQDRNFSLSLSLHLAIFSPLKNLSLLRFRFALAKKFARTYPAPAALRDPRRAPRREARETTYQSVLRGAVAMRYGRGAARSHLLAPTSKKSVCVSRPVAPASLLPVALALSARRVAIAKESSFSGAGTEREKERASEPIGGSATRSGVSAAKEKGKRGKAIARATSSGTRRKSAESPVKLATHGARRSSG